MRIASDASTATLAALPGSVSRMRRPLAALIACLLLPASAAAAKSSFVIRGAGFGHGVGMCQMGAIGMASAGKRAAQILAHYYRGSHLHRLY
jgi:stage II sporulation protein D